jgi:hypothetical protein
MHALRTLKPMLLQPKTGLPPLNRKLPNCRGFIRQNPLQDGLQKNEHGKSLPTVIYA